MNEFENSLFEQYNSWLKPTRKICLGQHSELLY